MSFFLYKDGYIAYKKRKQSISVLGDPIISDTGHKDCILSFIDRYPNACFYHVQDHSANILAKHGFYITDMGPQHNIHLPDFTGSWGHYSSLRSGVNKAKNKGITVVESKPSRFNRNRLIDIHRNWVTHRKNPYAQAFLIRPLDFKDRKDCRYFFAYYGGTVIAYYIFTPIYNNAQVIGYYADNCRYIPTAPKGVTDLLVYTALVQFKCEGYQKVGMGLCPFSELSHHPYPKHTLIPLLFKYIYKFNLPPYGYKGIHRYTKKFHGEKVPCYMASRSKLPLKNLYTTWRMTCRAE